MKQKIYISGIIFLIITVTGTLFKMLHLPGAGILLTLGFAGLLLIFFPAALVNSYRGKGDKALKPLYIVTYLTLLVIFTGMLFKIMHWPGAGKMLLAGLPFPFVVFLPVFLYVTGRIENFSIYNTVSILLLLTILSAFNALLALSVSRNSLDDSMYIASVYHKAAAAAGNTKLQHSGEAGSITDISDINESAGQALKLIHEATDQILRGAKADINALIDNPSSVSLADSRELTTEIMFNGDNPDLGKQLEKSIQDFIGVVETSGNGRITPQMAIDLLGFNTPEGEKSWSEAMFEGNWTSWSLVYLGILENNIILIRDELLSDAVQDATIS
ncbi:MAG: hypothetical protein LC649_06245 [Bacteroidales bacterium]|nr:hypothetical protein [Bacteroidales bacterium]